MKEALEFLKSYSHGDDVSEKGKVGDKLQPIEDAIVASQGDAAARSKIETAMIELLKGDGSDHGKHYACRTLKVIGTDASVGTLSSMLGDKDHSHMARYALQSIPGKAATNALMDAAKALKGELRAGAIGSLGARGDNGAVEMLGKLIGDSDTVVAKSAAMALGVIRTPEAAEALAGADPAKEVAHAVTDSSLACAEGLLASGDKLGALSIYKKLNSSPIKHVKLAATRGMLACAGGK